MPKSIVNSRLEYNLKFCVVSVLNYKGSKFYQFPTLSNHSVIIVERLIEEKKIEEKPLFPHYKSVIGRYEIAGLASLEEYSRVVILNEGMPRPERVPQDAIVLHKEAYQVTAYWRQGLKIANKMWDLREKGPDGELILGPFKNSQNRAEPYVVNKETNSQFVEKVISLYGCIPADDKKKDSSLINKKMWITHIGYKEGSPEDKEFKDKAFHQYPSRSFLVEHQLVISMLESIQRDQEICKRAAQGECDYLLYQLVGKNHLLSDLGEGDNCAGWCIDQLNAAGLKEEITGLKTKPKALAGQSCVIF